MMNRSGEIMKLLEKKRQNIFGHKSCFLRSVSPKKGIKAKLNKWDSVSQFSRSVMSDSLQSHELQHSRPPCPSPTPRSTQTHVHWVSDAIQPSHPLSSPSPPALNLSWHQGLFQWVSSSHQVAKYWSFSFNISASNEQPGLISFRVDWLDLLQSKGLSRVFSNTTV